MKGAVSYLSQMHHVSFVTHECDGHLRLQNLPGAPHEVERLPIRDRVHKAQPVGPLGHIQRRQIV